MASKVYDKSVPGKTPSSLAGGYGEADEMPGPPDPMVDAPPTPGTGDVGSWDDGQLENTMEREAAAGAPREEEEEDARVEQEPGTTINGENDIPKDPEEQVSTAIPFTADPPAVSKTSITTKRGAKAVASRAFKKSAHIPHTQTRIGSNACAQPPVFSSTTPKLDKMPTRAKFPKSVPSFDAMTIVPMMNAALASRLGEFGRAETTATDREAATISGELKAKKKAMEDRRAFMSVQNEARAETDRKASQVTAEVTHIRKTRSEQYHPDREKLAMAMVAHKPTTAGKTKPIPKAAADNVKNSGLMEEEKTLWELKKSKQRSDAIKRGKRKREEAKLEREESKRIAELTKAKNLAALPEHYQQGEIARLEKQRQMSDALKADLAPRSKRKRTETESYAPLKKVKTSKMPVHKDVSSPQIDEQKDEKESLAEMEGVSFQRKVLAHKKTKQLDNTNPRLDHGVSSLDKDNITSAAPWERHVSANTGAPLLKKRRREEADTRQFDNGANKKRKVGDESNKVIHTLYQHTAAWRWIRDGYKERNESVPRFVAHVEVQLSRYVLHCEKADIYFPAEPAKGKKRRKSTKVNVDDELVSQKQAEHEVVENDEEDTEREARNAFRKAGKDEEQRKIRKRLEALDRYMGTAVNMKNSETAIKAAVFVGNHRKEQRKRHLGFEETHISEKDRKVETKYNKRMRTSGVEETFVLT